MKKAAVIMGSDSDLPVLMPAIDKFKDLGIEFEVRVISAHRTPMQAIEFASNAAENGFGVVIAAAGKAAHLAGILAANTILPVIGIPVGASLMGIDALLATVQMPSGMPVATVGIDASANAAILAAQILALSDDSLAKKLTQMRTEMTEAVIEKDKKMKEKF
ncbi:MAG: 5-(carboxyamino)imidazole ribonucleotide mutase [Clostridia bacterium]|nr:5-(carboxyamino)imidazole ribonucleotide mutase [Clostridia bacterium]